MDKNILSGLAVVLFVLFSVSFVSATDRYVATTGTDAPTCSVLVSPCKTIQYAIGQSVSGDTINVAAGIYTEDLSIPSSKTNLDLSGTSATIKGVTTNLAANYPQAFANIGINASGVKLHGFTIESPGFVAGHYSSGLLIGNSNVEIYSNTFKTAAYDDGNSAMNNVIQTWYKNNIPGVDISGLNIHDNVFTTLSSNAAGYEGIYINLDTGSGVATIKNNQFSGDIFRAITTERSNTVIQGNLIVNDLSPSGATSYSGTGGWQGVNIGGANSGAISTISVTNNTIKGSGSGKGFSQGIKVGFTSSSTFSGVNIFGNTIQMNLIGIWTKFQAAGIVANYNNIFGNTIGVQNGDTEISLDATNNWWGSSTGPGTVGPGSGDKITGNVNFDPWLCQSYPPAVLSVNGNCPTGIVPAPSTSPFVMILLISALAIIGLIKVRS